MTLVQHRTNLRVKVALARKRTGILYRMWVSGSDFRSGAPTAAMEG